MSDGILGNLKDAWGVEDDGPDPTSLTGLLELSEGWLEDEDNEPSGIAHHFESMKNNVVGAHMERSQTLRSGKYDPQFVALVEKNLSDMVSIEKALEKFIEASSREERDECWEALGELEESVEVIKESTAAIERFLDSSPQVCMGCASIGEENICPKCGGERLKLDPNPPAEDERKVAVNDEVLAVYESYQAVLTGKAPLNSLVGNLQSLEFTYLEAEAIGEQTLTNEVATDRMKETAKQMLAAIAETLGGIEQMHSVVKSRSSADLNTGWKRILENSVKASDLLQKINVEASVLDE